MAAFDEFFDPHRREKTPKSSGMKSPKGHDDQLSGPDFEALLHVSRQSLHDAESYGTKPFSDLPRPKSRRSRG